MQVRRAYDPLIGVSLEMSFAKKDRSAHRFYSSIQEDKFIENPDQDELD
jgi:hypothetical protein